MARGNRLFGRFAEGRKNQDVADNRVRNIQELIDDLDGELTAEARRKKREEITPKKSTKPVDLENDPEDCSRT